MQRIKSARKNSENLLDVHGDGRTSNIYSKIQAYRKVTLTNLLDVSSKATESMPEADTPPGCRRRSVERARKSAMEGDADSTEGERGVHEGAARRRRS
jgi:hypothetical protein